MGRQVRCAAILLMTCVLVIACASSPTDIATATLTPPTNTATASRAPTGAPVEVETPDLPTGPNSRAFAARRNQNAHNRLPGQSLSYSSAPELQQTRTFKAMKAQQCRQLTKPWCREPECTTLDLTTPFRTLF